MSTNPPPTGVCATSRALPCPPERVLAAFANPTELATWWGPAGFTNTFEVFEFRPAGRWTFVMHGPDGSHHPNTCEFVETSLERVVIRHTCAPFFTLTVTLTAQGEGTVVHWSQAFDDPAVAAAIGHIIAPANEQNLDRLVRVVDAVGHSPV